MITVYLLSTSPSSACLAYLEVFDSGVIGRPVITIRYYLVYDDAVWRQSTEPSLLFALEITALLVLPGPDFGELSPLVLVTIVVRLLLVFAAFCDEHKIFGILLL